MARPFGSATARLTLVTWILAYVSIGVVVEGFFDWKARKRLPSERSANWSPARFVLAAVSANLLWPIGLFVLAARVEYDYETNKIVSPAWMVKR